MMMMMMMKLKGEQRGIEHSLFCGRAGEGNGGD